MKQLLGGFGPHVSLVVWTVHARAKVFPISLPSFCDGAAPVLPCVIVPQEDPVFSTSLMCSVPGRFLPLPCVLLGPVDLALCVYIPGRPVLPCVIVCPRKIQFFLPDEMSLCLRPFWRQLILPFVMTSQEDLILSLVLLSTACLALCDCVSQEDPVYLPDEMSLCLRPFGAS